MPDEGPTTGHLYKLENWANKHLEVVDFIGVGILTPELIEMPKRQRKPYTHLNDMGYSKFGLGETPRMEVPDISPIALLRTLTIDRLRDDLPIVADDIL